MEHDYQSEKSIAVQILEPLVKCFKLDPDRWEIVRIEPDNGRIPLFSDQDPDAPILCSDTDSIRDLDFGSVVVHISMKHGLRHTCSCCGGVQNVHKWLHTTLSCPPVLCMRAEACIYVPQLYCPSCDAYRNARCPLAIQNCTYTKLTKIHVASVATKQTMKSTAETCGVGEWIVADVVHKVVDEGKASRNLTGTRVMFIDEIQSVHGQNYVTMVADQDHKMISGVEGHDADSIRAIKDDIVSCGCDPDGIELISVDLSSAYRSGILEHFPKAVIILDRFHIVKMANEVVDKVRKRTNRELKKDGKEFPKRVKYTVLYRKRNQDEKQMARMEEVRLLNPELAKAFDLKEEFCDFFESPDGETARARFQDWYDRANLSGIAEMQDLARRLSNRLEDIIRWFDHRISNGVAEGMNSVYKRIKADAYGFRKPRNLIDFCMFRKGQLKVSI